MYLTDHTCPKCNFNSLRFKIIHIIDEDKKEAKLERVVIYCAKLDCDVNLIIKSD